QIRNQICSTLIDILHLRPTLIHRLLQPHQTIVTAANREGSNYDKKEDDGHEDATTESEFVHDELGTITGDYLSNRGVICEATTFHSPPRFTKVSVHMNFPLSRFSRPF